MVAVLKHLRAVLPSGGVLPPNVWRGRLRFLVGLTWFHAAIIAAAGLVLGDRWDLSLEHGTVPRGLAGALVVAAFAALASWRRSSRFVQATAVGIGLMASSAILVHMSGGYIELHFHFFVMLVFLALLQDWIPYLLAVAFVAVHHGVVGVRWPQEVYNHPAAIEAPWTFAAIHALFVLCACVGSVIAWRFNERAVAQTALILEATGEGIFGLDPDGTVTFVNPAAATMLGANAAPLVGQPLTRVLREVRPDGALVEADASAIVAPFRDRAPRHVSEASFERADGTRFPVDYISMPMTERGELTGVVVSFRDVTERRRVQGDLQRSHARLEEVLAELKTTQRQVLQQERLRAMGEMASGIAHDFNNSLSPILGFSELLLRSERAHDPGKVQTYARLINSAAQDASVVVRRLRELGSDRDESPAPGPVDLRACIEEAIALTQPRWKNQALASGATIQLAIDAPDVPLVAGDRGDFREILTSLIVNAVDAMPTGGTITLAARRDGDDVRLEVRDTGTGMADDVRQRCLEPFFSTKGAHGSGVGLPMVRALVERHRGGCAIESAPGRGTTVILRVPVHATPAAAAGDAATFGPARRLHILVVDDEPAVRCVIAAQLEDDGHTVDSASNGAEGLQKVAGGSFDLVLTDRAMPEMGGDELAAAIHGIAPNTPVIMVTGFGELMAAKGERPPGVTLVLSKPVTQEQLRDAIAHATGVTLVEQ